MIVGLPKEIKNNENRVGMVPAGVQALVEAGHEILVQAGAGLSSGFSDEKYATAGAKILHTAPEVWQEAEIIVKVKEPLPVEYLYFREGLILFTYLHLAAAGDLVFRLMENKVKAIAYETIQPSDGSLPLLQPMSEVAGRMSVQIGAHFLEKTQGGRGVLLGGVPGVEAGNVVIVGGGIVGTNAAKMAVGLRARVTILENNPKRLRKLEDLFGPTVQILMSNSYNMAKAVAQADLLVGAVLIPGAKAPHLVTEDMVKTMKSGSVIVDVAIDQGGCIETIDRVTTHDQPTYVKHGIVHYCVANMPGAVPYTSTLALTNATLPYLSQLAEKGFERAIYENAALRKGVNVLAGKVTYRAVAEAFGLEVEEL